MRAILLATLGGIGCSAEYGTQTLVDTGQYQGSTTTNADDNAGSDTGSLPATARVGRFAAVPHRRMGSLVYARWEQAEDERVRIEYSVDPGEWRSAPTIEGKTGLNELLIPGLPFSDAIPAAARQIPWRVVFESDGYSIDSTVPLEPGPVDPELPLPLLTVSAPDLQHGGEYLLTSINQENGGWTSGRFWIAIFDRAGRPVWALPVPDQHWSLSTRVSRDGTSLLWDESSMWSDGDHGAGSEVHRTFLDREQWVLDTPGLHAPFIELPDGTIAWASRSLDHGPSESIVEARPDEGSETVVWQCSAWLGSTECSSSSLAYHEGRNAFLVGLESSRTVVEVDRNTGLETWWAGEEPNGLRFVPSGSRFDHVHDIEWTEAGTLLVTTEMPPSDAGDPETVVREYVVTRSSGTMSQVWSHDTGLFATANPQSHRLDNGSTLYTLGSASQIQEIESDGRVVWALDFQGTRLLGRGSLISDLYALVSPPTE